MSRYGFLAIMKSLSVILENNPPEVANAKAKEIIDYALRKAEVKRKNDR